MSWLRNLSKCYFSATKQPTKTHLFQSSTLLSRFSTSTPETGSTGPVRYAGLGPTKPHEKPRVVVLGTGWAGCRFMKGLDSKIYDIVCVSPRNHMVFTPLLASTCVGTLEFRSVAEPVARIQPAISNEPGSFFFLANCTSINAHKHEVQCETVTEGTQTIDPWKFTISYDKLVIALGAQPTTFGIHGVHEHAIFLREVYHAQEIRRKLLLNLMMSDVPGITEEEKKRLLHCVVVGGGPTGVEFSGELSDFIMRDVRQRYAHVKDYIHVTLIEANEILSSFDDRLRHYATNQLTKVAERQGKYLAGLLNKIGKANGGHANSMKDIDLGDQFVYKHLGSMATVGSYKALVDLRQNKEAKGLSLAGFISWFVWRSAYLTRVISWRNRFYVAINWATTFVFGRDISRI
ncbi:internal alternative NAD(P)H-ubiquinone oxidoreductase A1, mitochondrial-like isoform X2 [Cicer arietinum]|uniref:NADH:ubiquinone reductase (non-electrogenic) n=1 Tax=Cicer arietinum TaxID=3827 RepID=A0A1S2XKA8_CICAR|nr:internal alternative NAD(P)H-ubiquinone oxidoreductase A1, mitochondrial-like isoform X2 [Cicer arietinum]